MKNLGGIAERVEDDASHELLLRGGAPPHWPGPRDSDRLLVGHFRAGRKGRGRLRSRSRIPRAPRPVAGRAGPERWCAAEFFGGHIGPSPSSLGECEAFGRRFGAPALRSGRYARTNASHSPCDDCAVPMRRFRFHALCCGKPAARPARAAKIMDAESLSRAEGRYLRVRRTPSQPHESRARSGLASPTFSFRETKFVRPCLYGLSQCSPRRLACRPEAAQKFGARRKFLWGACKALKSNKTAKGIFGNVWRKRPKIWKCLARTLKSLRGPRGPAARALPLAGEGGRRSRPDEGARRQARRASAIADSCRFIVHP